ncbi:TAF6-like RNA polymerase II p300/CBP-associated factor-associated factor 65 kDa subunit 6L [Babylonia areolata]|uniref:TAF6-like RNA polymerase II p300/CBP-associated factor-associated factor 65 kDa subunit 6L n=1 Tax=Babylonia areolata TaxID=304850 RepID=UPI003FD2704F
MEEKSFATIAKDSVKLMAESAGFSNVPDDVAALLGEDVNYRLREVVMQSTAFMKSAKRRRLCPDDFNQALRDMNVQPVFGHSSMTDCSPFRQTREGELHFIEENDINFNNTVCNSYVPKYQGETSIKAQWMALEGVNKFSSSSHGAAHLQNISKNIKKESSSDVMAYYSQITKALVGSRPALVRWALDNLTTSKRVQSALAFFINFVANGVKVVSHDLTKLTLLMKTVGCLVKNRAIYLEMQPYLRLLVQAVETCLLEPLASYMNQQSVDHWMLRRLAAGVLADIVRKWNTPVNRLKTLVTNKLTDTLQDLGRPLCSHFGAVMGLMALGSAEVEAVLVSQLPLLLPHLQASVVSIHNPGSHTQADAMRVLEAVQLAMEKLLRSYMDSGDLRDPDSSNRAQDSRQASVTHSGKEILGLYRQLSDCLGDALSARLPIMELDRVFRSDPSTDVISLGDSDSKRSGEELLADLMQQVRREEQEEQRRLLQQRLAEHHTPAGTFLQTQAAHNGDASDLRQVTNAGEDGDGGFQDQLAISSTISDPSKGTLKLKIKRQHPQGQGSPSQPPRLGLHHSPQHRDARDREHKLKRKRKQCGKSPWEEFGDIADMSDLDEINQTLLAQTAQAYSPGGESSGSESSVYKKGKLMLKLKVPSRDSPSE